MRKLYELPILQKTKKVTKIEENMSLMLHQRPNERRHPAAVNVVMTVNGDRLSGTLSLANGGLPGGDMVK